MKSMTLRPCDDPLVDTELEESLLSTMMEGQVLIRSLTPEDFTGPMRQVMYRALWSGVGYVALDSYLREKLDLPYEELAYITDVYMCPIIPERELKAAVAELKRLTLLRKLCKLVDTWRANAPHLTYAKAVGELGLAIRVSGGGTR